MTWSPAGAPGAGSRSAASYARDANLAKKLRRQAPPCRGGKPRAPHRFRGDVEELQAALKRVGEPPLRCGQPLAHGWNFRAPHPDPLPSAWCSAWTRGNARGRSRSQYTPAQSRLRRRRGAPHASIFAILVLGADGICRHAPPTVLTVDEASRSGARVPPPAQPQWRTFAAEARSADDLHGPSLYPRSGSSKAEHTSWCRRVLAAVMPRPAEAVPDSPGCWRTCPTHRPAGGALRCAWATTTRRNTSMPCAGIVGFNCVRASRPRRS